MAPQIFPRHKSPEDGIILLTVIMMIIVLSLIVIGFMSSSVSQFRTSQSVVDRLKAEELAIGAFYQYHQRQLDGAGAALPASEALDGKTFTISAPTLTAGAGPNNTNSVTFTITY